MADTLFFVAAGGTGIRVALALLHCCAYGALYDKSLNILILDTDQDKNADNANAQYNYYLDLHSEFDKLRQARERRFMKSNQKQEPQPLFFGAKIKLRIASGVVRDITDQFESQSPISSIDVFQSKSKQQKLLLKALLSEDEVNKVKPEEGLFSCPSLGALLFDHLFQKIEEISNNVLEGTVESSDTALIRIKRWVHDFHGCESGRKKLVLCASLFGGTGVAAIESLINILDEDISNRKLICLERYFSIIDVNPEAERWDEKTNAATKFFSKRYNNQFHVIQSCCRNNIGSNELPDRGIRTKSGQENWPERTEWLVAERIIACFLGEEWESKSFAGNHKFAQLANIWNNLFEKSIEHGELARWTCTFSDESLKYEKLNLFLAYWLIWYQRINSDYGKEVPIAADAKLEKVYWDISRGIPCQTKAELFQALSDNERDDKAWPWLINTIRGIRA